MWKRGIEDIQIVVKGSEAGESVAGFKQVFVNITLLQ